MATTRQTIIDQITANVKVVETSERDKTVTKKTGLPDGTILEDQSIPVRIVANADGAVKNDKQKISVIYDENGTDLDAWFADKIVKNYAAPDQTEDEKKLVRFAEIEADNGGNVKVDPKSLDSMGIGYIAYQKSDGKNMVSVTLGDADPIEREAVSIV
jgi:hypothetical protein